MNAKQFFNLYSHCPFCRKHNIFEVILIYEAVTKNNYHWNGDDEPLIYKLGVSYIKIPSSSHFLKYNEDDYDLDMNFSKASSAISISSIGKIIPNSSFLLPIEFSAYSYCPNKCFSIETGDILIDSFSSIFIHRAELEIENYCVINNYTKKRTLILTSDKSHKIYELNLVDIDILGADLKTALMNMILLL